MIPVFKKIGIVSLLVVANLFSIATWAQVDPSFLAGLKYRMIGRAH